MRLPHLRSTRPSEDTGDHASAVGSADAHPARRGLARVLRTSATGAIALVACCALTMIALLVGAFVLTQTGPGGALAAVRVGRPAPDFDLGTLDAGSIKLGDQRGHIVAVNFWTTWCPGCVAELPALAAASRGLADEDLVVVAVNAGEAPSKVERFLDERGIDIPVALDVFREVYRTYHVVGLPTTVWVDRAGIVRAVHLGALSPEDIDRYVREVDAAGATVTP
jgi:peroxiredoxin